MTAPPPGQRGVSQHGTRAQERALVVQGRQEPGRELLYCLSSRGGGGAWRVAIWPAGAAAVQPCSWGEWEGKEGAEGSHPGCCVSPWFSGAGWKGGAAQQQQVGGLPSARWDLAGGVEDKRCEALRSKPAAKGAWMDTGQPPPPLTTVTGRAQRAGPGRFPSYCPPNRPPVLRCTVKLS